MDTFRKEAVWCVDEVLTMVQWRKERKFIPYYLFFSSPFEVSRKWLLDCEGYKPG